MKPTYFLGIDAAKHKMRATLSNRSEHVLFEKDLSVEATGLRQLLAAIKRQVNDPEQLLVLIEATSSQLVGRAHQSRLCRSGDQSIDCAPALHAPKLHP